MKKNIKTIKTDSFEFSTDNFTGPLDLLLHLARTNEIEISDISLDILIDQYIMFVEQTYLKAIDIASSYLEMAAELIRLKSQSLLLQDDDEDIDLLDEIGLDRESLIEKLLEYQKYKEITGAIKLLIENRSSKLSRSKSSLKKFKKQTTEFKIPINDFNKHTKQFLLKDFHNSKETKLIDSHEVKLDIYFEEFTKINTPVCFEKRIKLLEKKQRINIFLALLEALKTHLVTIEYIDGLIYIAKGETNEESM